MDSANNRNRDSSISVSNSGLPLLKYRQSATIVENDHSGNYHYLQRTFDIKDRHVKSSDTFQFGEEEKKEFEQTTMDIPVSSKSLTTEKCLMLNFLCQLIIVIGISLSIYFFVWLDVNKFDQSSALEIYREQNLESIQVKIITVAITYQGCGDQPQIYNMFQLTTDQSLCEKLLKSNENPAGEEQPLNWCTQQTNNLPTLLCQHKALYLISSFITLFIGTATILLNVYGIICGICQMKGIKSYYLTVTAPLKLCWILYGMIISAWTLLNALEFAFINVGWWIFVGCSLASLIFKYHYIKYIHQLRKIRNFMLFMRDI